MYLKQVFQCCHRRFRVGLCEEKTSQAAKKRKRLKRGDCHRASMEHAVWDRGKMTTNNSTLNLLQDPVPSTALKALFRHSLGLKHCSKHSLANLAPGEKQPLEQCRQFNRVAERRKPEEALPEWNVIPQSQQEK
ncbi:rCG58493 [Rattus norvegicus]|uniref:RCG58493 n=1 Tax=Rattus norvegicus TaxID=10116 RepID=A6K6U5_RAT|nr:rCG58493 [Rattus norvegicus]